METENDIIIKVKRLNNSNIDLPKVMTKCSSGADICADIPKSILISPGRSEIIPTGLSFEIPEGYEIQVRPRSGLAAKHCITVLNTPGTIDADYRGELKVILINHHSDIGFRVEPGMRVAQLVVMKLPKVQYVEIVNEELTITDRGVGGFGHTGI